MGWTAPVMRMLTTLCFFVFMFLASISATKQDWRGALVASLFAIKFSLDSAAWLIREEKKP